MNGSRIGTIAVVVALGAAGLWWWKRPTPVVDLVVRDASGEPVHFADMRGDRDHLVVVFATPRDPLSKRALDVMLKEREQLGDQIAFAGLVYGTQDAAESYARSEGGGIPMYGLKGDVDPYQVNDLIEDVGTTYALRDVIIGGTVFVLDRDGRMVFKLEQREVDLLPERLRDLG